MKGLPTLIRLYQRELDGRRRRLAFLENRRDNLLASLATLEGRLVVEQETASDSVEAMFAYGPYARRFLMERDQFRKQIAKAEDEVAKARQGVTEAYGELKKYELAEAARARRTQAERDRAERIALDDMGVEIYRRRDRG